MDFGRIIFLWALPAVILPLLLHLFFRRRQQRVKFSTLLFFVRRERYFAYRRRLLEVVLLALRLLAILLLVLALTRIFVKKFTFRTGAQTAAVLVLDDSMSMQRPLAAGGSAYDFAVDKADEILNSLTADDSAALVLISGRPGVGLTRDKDAVRHRLRQVGVTGARGSLAAAFAVAAEQLRQTAGSNREIYILSDFQRTVVPAQRLAVEAAVPHGRVFCLPLREKTGNLAVTLEKMETATGIVGQNIAIPCRVVNYGCNAADVPVELVIDGNREQRIDVTVPAGGSTALTLTWTPPRGGRFTGMVRIADGVMPFDDAAFLILNVTGNRKIVLLSDAGSHDPDPFYYLRYAVDPDRRRHPYGFAAVTLSPGQLTAAALRDADWLWWSGDAGLPATAVTMIEAFLAHGGVLLTSPRTAAARLDRYAGNKAAMPWFVAPYGSEPQARQRRREGIHFLPPLDGFNMQLQLERLRWRRLMPLTVPAGGRIVATVDNIPAVVEQPVGAGRRLALGFDLRREFSNWPELKSFPIMMTALLRYAGDRRERTTTCLCGGEIELTGTGIQVRNRLGTTEAIPGVNGRGIYTDTWVPGPVFFSGSNIAAAVCRPDPVESDPAVVDEAAIRNCFRGKVALLVPGGGITAQV
ncbi:MAG: BatA domain-containing protein, partial [Victivallales bacterium]|nr:BatA domain-containing protein [Victivallales bacterium]